MKVKQMFKQKMFEMFFRQPTRCMPWQHTAEVLCGKWVDLGVAIGFAVSASKCSQNFVSSIVPTCANMCHYVPAWANIAVCQLCRDRRPLWNSHDGVCINAMVFGVCARGKSSADAKYLLRSLQIRSLNLIHEDTSESVFSSNLLSVGLPVEASNGTEIRDPNCYHLWYPQCINLRKL